MSPGGAYLDSSGAQQAFVDSDVNGVWSRAQEVAGALNAGGLASVYSVSCPSLGNCTAAGGLTDASGRAHAFAVSQVNGQWGDAVVIADGTALAPGDVVTIQKLSCSSVGNCNGVGAFASAANQTEQPMAFKEVDGVWGTPVILPGLTTLNPSGIGIISALSCPSASSCSVGGAVINLSNFEITGFIDDETNGVWGQVFLPSGIDAPAQGNISTVDSLSCFAPGDCTAGGTVTQGSVVGEAYVVSEVNGVWGNVQDLPGVDQLNQRRERQCLGTLVHRAGRLQCDRCLRRRLPASAGVRGHRDRRSVAERHGDPGNEPAQRRHWQSAGLDLVQLSGKLHDRWQLRGRRDVRSRRPRRTS